ncbi:MAG: ABC transporter permease [Anaerolinea sp.]|nr:ABC transporter permease [Anaerolinea sp.]
MSGSGGGLGGTSEPGGGIAGLTGRLASPVGAAAIARQSGIVTPFVVLFATLSIASETFLRLPNLMNILDQQAATVIVAAAGTLVLVAGGIDLSVGAVYALSGVTAATLASSADPLAAVVVGMFVGLVVGIANGIVVTRFRINALIATLAASYVVSGIGALVTRGNLVVAFEHPEFQAFAATRILGLTSAAWIMLAVTLILAVVLARSTFGRYVYASGGNADAARLAGVEVDRIRLAVFAISGLAAGLAGVIDASRVLSAQSNAGGFLAFTVLAGIVVGGTSILGGEGSVWRTAIGCLFIALIGNGFNLLGLDPFYRQITLGLILLLAVGIDAWSRRFDH